MKPFTNKSFTESDLIAYHLHELSPRKARALEAAIRSNPALAAESAAYADLLQSFKGSTLLDVGEDTMDRNWSRIWSRLPVAPLRKPLVTRWLVPAAAGLAFAATAVFVATRLPTHTPPSQVTSGITPSSTSATQAEAPVPAPLVPVPHVTTPLSVTTSNEVVANGSAVQTQRAPFTASQAAALIARLHNTPPRPMPVAPDGQEPAPMLQYIPLARAPLSPTQAPASIAADVPPDGDHAAGVSFKTNATHKQPHRDRYMEVTLAMGGSLIGTRDVSKTSSDVRTQGATHALSAVGSFHQQFRPAVGYRFTASYDRTHFRYLDHISSNGAVGQTDIGAHVYSFAGTYVVQGPHRGRLSSTVEAGTALIAFLPLPDANGSTGGANVRPAAVVGAGAEVAVTKHLAINAGFRTQIFKGPDFRSGGSFGLPNIATTLISNEPSIGVSYRFANK